MMLSEACVATSTSLSWHSSSGLPSPTRGAWRYSCTFPRVDSIAAASSLCTPRARAGPTGGQRGARQQSDALSSSASTPSRSPSRCTRLRPLRRREGGSWRRRQTSGPPRPRPPVAAPPAPCGASGCRERSCCRSTMSPESLPPLLRLEYSPCAL
eukprot:scaffold80740_cov27-Tisochrysis_lutea.AAC.1